MIKVLITKINNHLRNPLKIPSKILGSDKRINRCFCQKYKKKFSFPYIIAVKGKKKEEILENFKKRLTNNIELEFEEAKEQVKKIAIFRINEIIN